MNWTTAVTCEPSYGVEAGTLLGSGSQEVAELAGDGTVAVTRPGGRVELRATRDGIPARDGDGITIRRLHEVLGNVAGPGGDRAVCGPLRVGGHIAPGRELTATGPMRVEGNIDRAEIRAGGELHIEGRAAGAALVGGAHAALRGRLHEALLGVADEIDRLLDLASQLLRAAPDGGPATPARVIRVLCTQRFETLESRLVHARAIVISSQRDWPGLCAGLAAEVAAAHRAVAAPDKLLDPLGVLTWDWVPTGKISTNTVLSYETNARSVASAQNTANEPVASVALRANYAATSKLSARAGFAFRSRQLDTGAANDGTDRRQQFDVGLDWAALRNVTFGCAVSHETRNESNALAPYKTTFTSCTARAVLQ